MMGPITFSPDQHAGGHSVAFMRAKDGKWGIVTEWVKAN